MRGLAQIKQDFNNYISQQNPDINPNVKGTDWDIYGTAVAAVAASIYQDSENIRLAEFAQFASGLFLDYSAFSLGLPPRQGETFALVTAVNAVLPGSPFFFPAGTVFTSTFNSDQYTLINNVTMSTLTPTTFSLQAQTAGTGFQLPASSTLTNTLHSTVSITVSYSTDGELSESDGQLRKRILEARQNPTGSGRASDYNNWAIIGGTVINPTNGQITNNIQGAIVVPQFFPNNSTVGVFVYGGDLNYNDVLINVPAGTYTLTPNPASILAAQTYINTQRPVQASVYIQSVSTFLTSDAIVINVVLPAGVTLSTTVTNFDGSTISVSGIIFQEFRRGFITYQFGGTILASASYILLSYLEQVLDVGLSVNGGIYQQIIVDREILVNGLPDNIVVPYLTLDSNNNYISIYDIQLSSVTINQVSVI